MVFFIIYVVTAITWFSVSMLILPAFLARIKFRVQYVDGQTWTVKDEINNMYDRSTFEEIFVCSVLIGLFWFLFVPVLFLYWLSSFFWKENK